MISMPSIKERLRRSFTITGDELTVINPASSAGKQTELTYKRAK
jgi:hypothetical protein